MSMQPTEIRPPRGRRPRARALARPRRLHARPVRYPNAYAWFVFLAALDIMLTYLILNPVLFARDAEMTQSRGREANAVANWVLEHWGVPGITFFKFALVVLVVIVCEVVGRYKEETGRRLAEWSVAITSIPVVVAIVQMVADMYQWRYG